MVTKRTPIGRPPRSQFTPAMIKIFLRMQRLEAACSCTMENRGECQACDRWWVEHANLRAEFGILPPWQYPIIQHPDADPEPADPRIAKPDRDAQARYRALQEALLLKR